MLALAPQVEAGSFINKLFRFFSLPAVFVKCTLSYSVRQLGHPKIGWVALMPKALAIQIN